jgi:hypothetical protein
MKAKMPVENIEKSIQKVFDKKRHDKKLYGTLFLVS